MPSNMFNFDATSILLESSSDDPKKLRLAEGSKAELRELGLNPAFTSTRSETSLKKRGITVISQTSADGKLSCIIIKIKDGAFKKVVGKCLEIPNLPYRVYVVKIPSAKYTKTEK